MFQRAHTFYFQHIQNKLLFAFLALVYIVGGGMTYLYMLIFKRKMLLGRQGEAKSFWHEISTTSDNSSDNFERQS